MHAETTHKIIAVDDDLMVLVDTETNQGVVKAQRMAGKKWKLTAKDQEDRVVKHGENDCATPQHHSVNTHETTRCAAIHAMSHWAHELDGGEFIHVSVPYWYEEDETGTPVKRYLRDEA